MKDITKRILTAVAMIAGGGGAAVAEYFGIPAVRWLAVAVVLAMISEMGFNLYRGIKSKKKDIRKFSARALCYATPFAFLLLTSAFFVGGRPWIILLLLMTIAAADTGAWFFGKLVNNDKMWPALSPNKTWAGQIAGIVCGTVAAVLYGLLGTDTFLPQLMWIGISISLLSQYGDLTASWLKRKLGIKDFGHTLPGHGGVLDRFDGWIYVLPLIWLVMI